MVGLALLVLRSVGLCVGTKPNVPNALAKISLCVGLFYFFLCRVVVWLGVEVSIRVLRPAIATNGKGLCEVRATATEISRGDRTLAKTFSIF